MRYTAENLRGCLVETMARFPPNPAADALLAAVEFVDADDDPELSTGRGGRGLAGRATCRPLTVVTPQPLLVDIEAADLLVDLDIHPLVREAIDNSPLSDGASQCTWTEVLFGWAAMSGVPSRRRSLEHCMNSIPRWTGSLLVSDRFQRAVLGDLRPRPVDVAIGDLSVDDPVHREAVRAAATLLKVPLPPAWRYAPAGADPPASSGTRPRGQGAPRLKSV